MIINSWLSRNPELMLAFNIFVIEFCQRASACLTLRPTAMEIELGRVYCGKRIHWCQLQII